MSEDVAREFLARLWQLQAESGLNDTKLARLIGVDRSYLGHLKAGRRGKRLGLPFVMGAIRLYPELGSFLLPSDVTTIAPTETTVTDAGEGQ